MPLACRIPQSVNLLPTHIMLWQADRLKDALDVEPFDRLIAIESLKIADQHGVVESEPSTQLAKRRGRLSNEQANLDSHGGQVMGIEPRPVPIQPIVPCLAQVRDTARY